MESNNKPRRLKLWWQSSYDRGLDIALFMWPAIKKAHPEAELHIAYGWNLFDAAHRDNAERMGWKKQVQKLMKQPGIFHYGRVGQGQLATLRQSCGILFYPTYFEEINFIGALESQSDGLVPVTMNSFAMKETVGSGIKIDGSIKDFEVQEEFSKQLIALMGDEEKWEEESKKAHEFAQQFVWSKIASDWLDVVEGTYPPQNVEVTVVTPTIRDDMFDVMAQNLSHQRYKNFTWLILDDHKTNRQNEARAVAEKYGITINYIRGDKALGSYSKPFGLSRANNKALSNSKGDLLIWLQDFVLLNEHGIQRTVDIYRHQKDALISGVDYLYEPVYQADGALSNATGILLSKSVRQKYQGLYRTTNPFDFELNFAGIPRHVAIDIGGWLEKYDQSIGYDNVEFALRAMEFGYEVYVDDGNICEVLNIGNHTKLRGAYPPNAGLYQELVNSVKEGKVPVGDLKL